jgi:hypothetical protein
MRTRYKGVVGLLVLVLACGPARAGSLTDVSGSAGMGICGYIPLVTGMTTLDLKDTSAISVTVTVTDPNGGNVALADKGFIWNAPAPGQTKGFSWRGVTTNIAGTYKYSVVFSYKDSQGQIQQAKASGTFVAC